MIVAYTILKPITAIVSFFWESKAGEVFADELGHRCQGKLLSFLVNNGEWMQL